MFEDQFRRIASLFGDKARSLMLWNLLDGRAYTATELSICADISPQSASNHLTKLVGAGILEVRHQGRHRYYAIANPVAADVIESMASLLPADVQEKAVPNPVGIKFARTCYDHLAGKVGVAVTEALTRKGVLVASDREFVVTPKGTIWLANIGLDTETIRKQKRSFAHKCIDWSERKPHLAGALGAAFLQVMLTKDWIRKARGSREVSITRTGKAGLRDMLNLEF